MDFLQLLFLLKFWSSFRAGISASVHPQHQHSIRHSRLSRCLTNTWLKKDNPFWIFLRKTGYHENKVGKLHFIENPWMNCSQTVVTKPATSVSPVNFLEMKILWAPLRPPDSDTLGGGAGAGMYFLKSSMGFCCTLKFWQLLC